MRSAFQMIGLGFLLSVLAAPGTAFGGEDTLGGKLKAAFENGDFPGLHGVYAELKGEPIAEVYFKGEDERWGDPLGERLLTSTDLHDLRSVTKSIVGLLYGIALGEGKVPAPDAGLLKQFPQYADLDNDPRRSAILVRDVLSMKMGTEWNEQLPYTDPKNSEIAMERAKDRYRFVLDRPMTEVPGTSWTYNGGATAIAAKLIADGTGMALEDYAAKALFAPLGITDFEWVGGSDGVASAASGLRLNAPDLAKIGRMVANDGKYQGAQVVPEDWLAVSFEPRATVMPGLSYGYFWWLDGNSEKPRWVSGSGNGGQRLHVVPETGLVLVVFAGNYNQPEAWRMPVKIIADYVLPEVRKRMGRN